MIAKHVHKKPLLGSSENNCTTFPVANIQAQFIESIFFDPLHSYRTEQAMTPHQNEAGSETKLTRLQLYPETDLASKYCKTLI